MGHPLESCTSSDTVAGYVIKFDDQHVTIRTRCGEIVVGAYAGENDGFGWFHCIHYNTPLVVR